MLLTAIGRGIGFIAIAFMLTFLGTAVRNRASAFRGFWIGLALAGGLLGRDRHRDVHGRHLVRDLELPRAAPHTVDRADDIGNSSVLVAAQLIGIPGTQAIGISSLALGMGWVVICLNAMRIGLLTRFMGVLGVICGALIVLPILSPLPIVQTFWLGAMAVLLAGRWPNGVPPAWTTGEAVPWPSQARVRESRRAQVDAAAQSPRSAAHRRHRVATGRIPRPPRGRSASAAPDEPDSDAPGPGTESQGPRAGSAPAHLREEGARHARPTSETAGA